MSDARDHYLRRSISRGEVRIALGDEDPQSVENADGFLDLDDGTVRTFTVLTLAALDRIMTNWQRSGECLSGTHLRVPNLIVLRTGGVDNIIAALDDLADELPTLQLDDDA